ncbi:MAG: cytochrome c3 family protein [Candidatus Zixiibacteriota bacterium]|nr:MAG: cytochrome c3 family protein [candidate division Zixibacteria bacterium]
MAQIFPQWTNKLPVIIAAAALIAVMAVVGFFWYFGSPKYTDVGYRPVQPIPYSHKLHAGDLGIDCRYCHYSVEYSASANVPPTSVCMNCHQLILPQSEKLLPVRESWATGRPIEWIRVHKIGEYAYFNHSIHLDRGVGCNSCHGNVAQMEIVGQKRPLSMGWCLDCHRNPAPHLRPAQEVTNTSWVPPDDHGEYAARIIEEKGILPPEVCSACHR